MATGIKKCPLCDTEINVDAAECSSCGADLSIFDIDHDGKPDFDMVKIEDSKSLDELLDEISKSETISSDIVEDLKTIGKNSTKLDQDVVESRAREAEAAKMAEEEQFECPSCNTLLPLSANSCSNCGVEFVDEEAVQFQCPECGTMLDRDVTECSNCGVLFQEEGTMEVPGEAEGELEQEVGADVEPQVEMEKPEAVKDPHQMLQDLVGEVKSLLLMARKYEIDVTGGMDLINKAVMSTKKKDTESALEHVKNSKESVRSAMRDQISDRLKKLKEEISDAQSRGLDVEVGAMFNGSVKALKVNDYETSIQSYFQAKESFEASCSDFVKAKENLDMVGGLIKDSAFLHFDISDSRKSLKEIKAAIDEKDWGKASKVAMEGKHKILKLLPTQIQDELKKARSVLLDRKSKDMDIVKPMKFIKEATIAFKKQEYGKTLKNLVLFRQATKTV